MLWTNPSDRTWKYPLRPPSSLDEPAMWMTWLIDLRWVALAAQAVVIAVSFNVIDRPALTIPIMVTLMILLAAANVTAARRVESGAPILPVALFNHLWYDLAALTVMLLMTGGPGNPFVALYAVHVAMAAVVLNQRGATAIFVAALACFGLLHLGPMPLHLDHHPLLSAGTLGTLGQFVAFAVTLGSVGAFVSGTSESLRRREAQLRDARQRLGEGMTEEVPHPATREVPL